MLNANYLLFPAKDAKQKTETINSDQKTTTGEVKECHEQLDLFLWIIAPTALTLISTHCSQCRFLTHCQVNYTHLRSEWVLVWSRQQRLWTATKWWQHCLKLVVQLIFFNPFLLHVYLCTVYSCVCACLNVCGCTRVYSICGRIWTHLWSA